MPSRPGRPGAGLDSARPLPGAATLALGATSGRAAAPGSSAPRGVHRSPQSDRRQRRSLEPNRALSASRSPLPAARAPLPSPSLRPSPSPRPPLAALSAVLYRLFFNPFCAVRFSSAKPIYCREKESLPPTVPLPLLAIFHPSPSPAPLPPRFPSSLTTRLQPVAR